MHEHSKNQREIDAITREPIVMFATIIIKRYTCSPVAGTPPSSQLKQTEKLLSHIGKPSPNQGKHLSHIFENHHLQNNPYYKGHKLKSIHVYKIGTEVIQVETLPESPKTNTPIGIYV